MRRPGKVRDRRVDINLEFDSLEKLLSEYISNISRSGAFVRTREPWPVGTRLRMKFTILADDPEIFEATAEVVRVSETPSGMGVSFLELTEDSRRLIDRVVDKTRVRRPTVT
jgi:uncharacterized protein (TIGR02266 family)